jgi:hypothetical protein
MTISAENMDHIIRSIETLPPNKIEEVIHFINVLKAKPSGKKSAVNESYLLLQQASLSKIWEDEEDLYEL